MDFPSSHSRGERDYRQIMSEVSENSLEEQQEMPFLEHFAELRSRILKIVIAVLVFSIACFSVAPLLYDFLARPIYGALPESSPELIFISPVEPFFVYLKLSVLMGIVATLPWTFFQIWRFIAPALYKHEKRAIVPLVLVSTVVFIIGIAFCYAFILPLGMQALIGAGITEDFRATAQISMSSYYDLVIRLLLAFGLVFEMPIFSYFLSRLGVIDDSTLKRHWRVAVIVIFIVAAVLTPPDVITQSALGLPMCLLYVLSIYVAKIAKPKELVEAEKLAALETPSDFENAVDERASSDGADRAIG